MATTTTLPAPLSPPPLTRPPSSAATERMRARRSSSRITDGTPSRASGGDDDVARTAVKVAVRVRPPLRASDPGYDLIPQRFRESTCEVPSPSSLVVQSQQGKKSFLFDRVFDEDTTQQGVWDYVSDGITSFVQGYNVSILAYGQSGAGKSYTMGTAGPDEQSDLNDMGIVPRAAQALFEKLNSNPSKPQSGIRTPKRYSTQALPTLGSLSQGLHSEKNWTLKASYAEIYNEQLRDLLLPESVPVAERAHVAIREDAKGRILLTGLTQLEINTVEDLLGALTFGSSIRQTDATAINARSSRSHAVFSLNLIQKKTETGTTTPRRDKRMSMPMDVLAGTENVVTIDSKLHFVDLAGSERLKNTGATGERAKEGISINAGLASLGKVIAQLSSRNGSTQQHISYRDSRLTRLLQDSLGGNAITFMVACVTPASFHMNETLNTLHYAQRARQIQSKPEIQQSHEDGDKQAAIDRLRAEVAFLRDQIRHSESSEAPSRLASDRPDRKEAELQTQLMDIQENYNALNQRHARLISEISKARDDTADTPILNEAIGDNSMERLKRSNSFAEAVEQVVLEYEKTIQSLETSLSNTRASLSNTESSLLEKQTRIAYMETIQQQLQARVAKSLDREQNNESYLRDLEVRMEGTTSGEEKNATLIAELRKEIARVRDSESSAEDYISTLEEKLAEAEQDQEIMQREIERLEHVIERQRSIGRLDNLLQELDNARQTGETHDEPAPPKTKEISETGGQYRDSYDPFRPPPSPAKAAQQTNGHHNHENDMSDIEDQNEEGEHDDEVLALPSALPSQKQSPPQQSDAQSPAQNDIMADKLENLAQELFDLRSDHDIVLSDYDLLQQKYRTALETLAKLEYDKETPSSPSTPSQSRPSSFLATAGTNGEEKELQSEGQPSSSRSVFAELSSRGVSDIVEEDADETSTMGGQSAISSELDHSRSAAFEDVQPGEVPLPGDELNHNHEEVATLRRLHAEREVSVAELSKDYQALAEQHQTALQHIEDLKQDLVRAQNLRPSSPSFMPGSPGFSKPILRRKSEDMLSTMTSDRASRSFASLKNIALDNFEQNPDARQSFEMNVNTLMTELHGRSERVHSLEAELTTVKKEMESKQAIISGLTRERSSLKANSVGMDFSVVGQMRDQLMESENQIRALHEQHSVRERDFQDQVEALKASLAEHQKTATSFANNQLPTPRDDHMPGEFPTQAAAGASRDADSVEQAQDIARLQEELAAWETKHHEALSSMTASETKLLETIASLEASMRQAENSSSAARAVDDDASATAAASFEQERAAHKTIVETLQKEIDEYKSLSYDHVSKLDQLQQAYSNIVAQVDEDAKSRDLTQTELQTHRSLVANLENQLDAHKSAISIHQESLDSLHASHKEEMEGLKASMDDAEFDSQQRYDALEEQHKTALDSLQNELLKLQSDHTALLTAAASALGRPTDATKLHSHIRSLVDEGKELQIMHVRTTDELNAVQEELQSAIEHTNRLEETNGELRMLHEESKLNYKKLADKEMKSSRLVEELEEQLNSNFDSHQAANRRLSNMETATVHARQEMERELEDAKLKNVMLEQQVQQFQRQSVTSDRGSINWNRESLSPEAAAYALARSPSQTSQLRKSSVPPTALPTPPPSIPLPPLPGNPSGGMSALPSMNGTDRAISPVHSVSPPASRHASKDATHGLTQLIEEQEARIRTIEKHLFAEKQLTATLEEALVDLETSANRTKSDMEGWRKRCAGLEDELVGLRKDKSNSRASLQAVEEEREMRVRAERARQALEQRMMELNANNKKKKKNALNCF